MSQEPEVKLMMDDGLANGLEVRRLSLKEGICRIPTAEVILYSKNQPIKMDALAGYVEQLAALEISRTDAATTRRTTRWFSGMVTSVEGHGVVAECKDGDIFEYRMTIQPRLVNLCYSRSGHNFRQVTALEAVKEVLKGLEVEYGENLPESAQMKQDFFQRRESDYGFLMRILGSCGLCYGFRTPAQTSGSVVPPVMHVGMGNTLPTASDFLCDGEETLPSAFSCVAVQTYESYCRMDSWRMRKSIGIDRLEVGYTNRAGKDVRGAAGDGDTRRVKMGEGLSADAEPNEIDRLAEEHLKKLRASTMGWTGSTQCLEALPGNLLKVNHFYGRNSKDVIEALVCGSTLECTVPVASGEVDFGDGGKASVHIDIECLSGTLAAVEVNGAAESANVVAAVGNVAAVANGGGGEAVGIPFIEQATVVGTSNASKNDAVKFVDGKGYVFKASADGGETEFEVCFTQPVGGYGQGLFRMPRVGDRILVLGVPESDNQNTYYLLGYLPGENMPFTTANELKRSKKADEKHNTALPEEMLSMRFQPVGSVPDEAAQTNAMGIRREKGANACSEIAFYNTHVGRKWTADGNNVEETFDASVPAGRKVLANFQSTGNMQLSANDEMEQTAKNFTFKCPGYAGWNDGKISDDAKVSFETINRFVVEAEKEISFKVGHNSITIDQNGISIRALKWNDAGGPLDSYIYMDSISGVSIGGMECSMNGFMGASISDAIGAGVALGSGLTSISGGKISLETLSKSSAKVNAAGGALSLASEITAFVTHGSETAQKANYGFQNVVSAFVAGINYYIKGWPKTTHECVILVFNIIAALIDLARLMIDAIDPDWLSKPASGQKGGKDSFTNRDALRLACLGTKAVAWTTTFIWDLMDITVTPATCASFELKGGKLTWNGDVSEKLFRKEDDNKSLGGGETDSLKDELKLKDENDNENEIDLLNESNNEVK